MMKIDDIKFEKIRLPKISMFKIPHANFKFHIQNYSFIKVMWQKHDHPLRECEIVDNVRIALRQTIKNQIAEKSLHS